MINETYPTILEAWEGIYFSFLEDRPGTIDFYQRNILHSYDNHIMIEQGTFDYDLGRLGMTPTKWTKFTGQYVDVEKLHVFVENAMNVKAYDSLYQFKDVPPNFSGRKAVHQWGKCLLGLSFRRQGKQKPTLTLYTRAQSIGFSGVADYALGAFIIARLAERIGIEPEGIRFQIFCPNFILKTVETVAFLHERGLLDQYMEQDSRIGDAVRFYYQYMDRDEEEIAWRAARRWKRKLERSMAGDYREMHVNQLSLKGWQAEKRVGRKLSARDSAKLVLTGIGRRGPEEIQIEDDDPAI